MATRLYLAFTGAPAISPAFGSGWDITSSAIRRPCGVAKSGSTLGATSGSPETSASVVNVLVAQYVSLPLTAQTISGTFSAVMRCVEVAASADASLQCIIRLVDSSGTERAVLYAGHTAALNTTADALGQEFGTSSSTRIIPAGTALTSQTAQDGDRLVIEFGWRAHNTTATSQNATLRFGDPVATADFALTSGLVTDLCPWVEFSGTVSFKQLAPFTDAFGRTDITSTLGPPWIMEGGAWGIQTGQAYNSSGTNNNVADIDHGTADGTVQADVPTLGVACGIAFRVQDSNNFWRVKADDGGVNYRSGGVFGSNLFVCSQTGTGTWKVVLAGTSISVYKDATLVGSGTSSLGSSATKHGMYAATNVARLDNYSFTGSATTYSASASGDVSVGGSVAAGGLHPASGSGSVAIGGSVSARAKRVASAAGSVAIGGSVAARAVRAASATGALTVGGSAAAAATRVAAATGAVTVAGSVSAVALRAASAVGSVSVDGSVSAVVERVTAAAGTVSVGGTAAATAGRFAFATGAVSVAGTVTAQALRVLSVVGSVEVDGVISAVAQRAVSAVGDVQVGGAASAAAVRPATVSGAVSVGGTVSASTGLAAAAAGAVEVGAALVVVVLRLAGATGEIGLGGRAVAVAVRGTAVVGAVDIGGAVWAARLLVAVASGQVELGGTVVARTVLALAAVGQVVIGGSASATRHAPPRNIVLTLGSASTRTRWGAPLSRWAVGVPQRRRRVEGGRPTT